MAACSGEIKINIPTPEDINRQIIESVAKSAIGEVLCRVIDEKIRDLNNKYSDSGKVVDKIINDLIAKLVIEILNDKYKDEIREQVRNLITDKMMDAAVEKLWEQMFK